MSPEQQLLIVWLTFAVLGCAAVIVVLVWAVRSGQFAHQDRARHLPLEAGIPEEKITATAKTTATTSPRSAGGFNGKTPPGNAGGFGGPPRGTCVPPSSGTPLGGAEGDKASPGNACSSAPATDGKGA